MENEKPWSPVSLNIGLLRKTLSQNAVFRTRRHLPSCPAVKKTKTPKSEMNDPHKHAELIGPMATYEHYEVSVKGFKVPNIKIKKYMGESDGKSEIILDDRLSYIIDDTELDVVLALVADAMAFGAGYASHGQPNKRNEHYVKVMQIGEVKQ